MPTNDFTLDTAALLDSCATTDDGQAMYANLEAAFKKIQPKDHWKDEIRAIVPFADYDMANAACQFFTATVLEIKSVDDAKEVYACFAIGYRAGPAGDH